MIAEKKLDVALQFLKEKNTSGSYLYYRKDQIDKSSKENLLFYKFDDEKIEETEWLPIVFHLIRENMLMIILK